MLIDPRSGTTLFQLPFGQRGPTVNAATPICFGNRLFLTASYGIGAKLIEFSERDHREIWANDESLSSQYNTPVFYRDNLLGIHGREDLGAADLRCVDAHNGVVKWNRPGFGVANLILADGSLICVTVDGQLVVVVAAAPKYTELSRCQISSSTPRALPALSAGRLYVKDNEQLTSWRIGP
jgi:outer membrane protein assembly factor BamB